MTESEILEMVRRADLSRVADEVAAKLQPSIRIAATGAQDAHIPPGVSKFGGTPDLPAGMPWPEYDGRPLAFIGQLRLADIVPLDAVHLLPASGLLSFFYDASQQPWGFQASDQGGRRVLSHTVDPALLHPSSAPPGLSSRDVFEPCRLHFSEDVTLPPLCSITLDSLGLTEEEWQAYADLELKLIPEARGGERIPVHRMFGHPDDIQGDWQSLDHPPVLLVARWSSWRCGIDRALVGPPTDAMQSRVSAPKPSALHWHHSGGDRPTALRRLRRLGALVGQLARIWPFSGPE